MFIYLSLCYSLLPALSAVLKVRRRKLAQTTNRAETVMLTTEHDFSTTVKQCLISFSHAINNQLMNSAATPSVNALTLNLFKSHINHVLIKFASSQECHMTVFLQAQTIVLLTDIE
jgi:hypothetical protein